MEKINKTKIKKMLYEFNQLAKSVYDSYSYKDSIALPFSKSSVKNPELFSNSLLVNRELIELPFIQNTVIDPVTLNNAIKDTKLNSYIKTHDTHYLVSGNDETYYAVSRDLLDNEVNKSKFLPMINTKDYNNEYVLSKKDIDLLLGYNTVEFNIGSDKNKDIRFICTLKVFPAIKKANSIVVYSKPYNKNENIYMILICSIGDTWSFYSLHSILNF